MEPDAYEPYLPQMTPVSWAEDVWIVNGPSVAFRVCGCTIPCPTRMTIVRLPGRRLWLHSPVVFSSVLATELDEFGRIDWIVAPNRLHRSHIDAWARAYPSARLLGFLSAERGIEERTPDDEFGSEGDLEWVRVELGRFSELAFFHRRSRTLIVADILQTFEAERVRPWLARWLLVASGATGPDPRPSLEVRWAARRHAAAAAPAIRQIQKWEPTSIVLSHGPCLRAAEFRAASQALAGLAN